MKPQSSDLVVLIVACFALAPISCARRESTDTAGKTSGAGAMAMSMPEMAMSAQPRSDRANTSTVSGHSVVQITPMLAQQIGVTIGEVEELPLRMHVRTVGIVRPNETRLAEVYLKTEGWVDKLFVNFTGQIAKAGDPLLTIYSPSFLSTQQEYLTARQAQETFLAAAAQRRLELWDVPASEIEELERTKTPRKDLTLRSPLSGTVLQRNAFQGQRVTPADKLFVIADLSTVWVQAKVYEYELPHIGIGQLAHMTVAALPNKELSGKVVFIDPVVEEPTRTTQVRIELANQAGTLKPGMFAQVVIDHEMGTGLLVPSSAVLRTGERNLLYRADAEGKFVPVDVKIDEIRYEGKFHILAGAKAGDRIVTSANFLIDSESRLRSGGGRMAAMPGMDMKEMPGMEHGAKNRKQH